MKVFLSHSSENSKAAQEVCAIIEKEGYECFLAPRDIRSGREYAEEIIDGIDSSDVMLLLLSERSNSSPHVLREVERAVSKRIPIVVYELEKVKLSKSMEYFLMTHQWVDSKADKGYQSILGCLSGFAPKAPLSAARETDADDAGSPHVYDITQDDGKSDRSTKIAVIVAAAALVLLIVVIVVLVNVINVADDMLDSSEPQASISTTEQQSTTSATEPTTTAGTALTTTTTPAATTQTTTEATTAATSQTTTEYIPTVVEPVIDIELGDTVVLGQYNGAPIEWRVIKFNDDGKSAVVIADKILTMKCFDAAESGRYNYYLDESYWSVPDSQLDELMMQLVRGDNRWAYSNIRTWLNSDRENVQYEDQPPASAAMSEKINGYDHEPGFLHDFTDDEIDAILTTQVETYDLVTEDKVFLLSEEELQWLVYADVSKYGEPTPEAVEQDDSNWYIVDHNDLGVDNHYWWLRTTVEGSACEAYTVGNSRHGGELVNNIVGAEGFGIRPAMTIDLTSDAFTAR